MKLLPAAVAAAVLILSAGTVWIGSRLREDTVVAHPYEEGLGYDAAHRARLAAEGHPGATGVARPESMAACDLGSGPCSHGLGRAELTLELGPRPLATMRELWVTARLAPGGASADDAEVRLSFSMPGMDMGENVVRLAPAGGGLYRGRVVLIRCRSGRRDWVATATVRLSGAEERFDFPLRVRD
ncbi:MAG TPA: hypothetical protein VFG59_15720 [Anaeromyxobacter sp.]|nr:hypothetical protein [Anaeromyxobacter sp.]